MDDTAGERENDDPMPDPGEWPSMAVGAAAEADRLLHASVDARPLTTLGVAAGIGFILGIRLPRGAVTMLLGVGARFAGAWIRQGIAQSLQATQRPAERAAHRAA
jgi:hypothetical protein